MVNDLLDFTQTALGVPLPVSPSPADLGQLAEHIVREVSTVYPDSRITESHEGDLTGHWDPERIGQMFSNLIGNAVQHGLHGRPVSVRVSAEGDSAVVRIRNEGAPIPVEAQKTLFSPLRQAAGAQPSTHAGSSGLGLGLYITREIAVAHGGSVEVSSADGFVTFCVRLPRKPPASARLGAPSAGNAGSGSPH